MIEPGNSRLRVRNETWSGPDQDWSGPFASVIVSIRTESQEYETLRSRVGYVEVSCATARSMRKWNEDTDEEVFRIGFFTEEGDGAVA